MESVYLDTNKETDVLIEPVSFHIESAGFILPSCLLTNSVPILLLCCNEVVVVNFKIRQESNN